MKKNSHNVNSETTIVQSKIENEFRNASNSLEKVVPAVTMFGSARINKNDKYYEIIGDYYNSNPQSLQASLEYLAQFNNKNKIV